MRAKRVCHVAQTAYAVDPRVRKQVESLANAGYEVDVVCLRDQTDKPASTPDSVHFYYVPMAQKRSGIIRYLFEYLFFFACASITMMFNMRKRYDVIHVSNMPDALVFCTLVPKLLGTKIVLDIHDPMPELFVSKFNISTSGLIFRILMLQEKISMRYAHHVITVTYIIKERMQKLVHGVDISVIMNLPDRRIIAKPVNTSEHSDEFRLVFTGTIAPRYCVDMVVECISHLKNKICGLKLRLIGGGDGLDAIKNLVEELHLEEKVEIMGWVPSSQIPSLLADCHLGVAPGLTDIFNDMAFHTKAADYVAMGLPTIACRTKAEEQHFPEGVVHYYEGGDATTFESAVLDLYGRPELRAEMSEKGIKFSQTANWETEKIKYVAIIDKLCRQDQAQL